MLSSGVRQFLPTLRKAESNPTGSSVLFRQLIRLLLCSWLLAFSVSGIYAQTSGAGASPPAASSGSPPTATPASKPSTARPSGINRRKYSAKDLATAASEIEFASWGKKFYLSVREQLGPYIKRQFKIIIPPFQVLGWLILTFLFLTALVTLARENQSAAGLGGLLIRGIFCSFIVGYSTTIVDQLAATGTFWLPRNAESFQAAVKEPPPSGSVAPVPGVISSPSDADFASRTSVLTLILDWRDAQARKYYEGYQSLVNHGFKVKVGNSEIWQAYKPDLSFVIPSYDSGNESAIDYARRLNLEKWSPSSLLALLNGSVVLMNVGILFSTVLSVFLIAAFKLLSPVFFAIAIHKKYAQQLTSPFVRGLLVATLLLPSVNIILEGLCYSIACLGFAPFYLKQGAQWQPAVAWDEVSVSFVGNMGHLSSYVFIAAFLTAISSLCMILAPVIAYKIAQGEMFSSAVGSVSGWTAGLIGIGMSAFSSALGTLFQREAEHFQNLGAQAQRQADAAAARHMGRVENQIAYAKHLVSTVTKPLSTYLEGIGRSMPHFTGPAQYASSVVNDLFPQSVLMSVREGNLDAREFTRTMIESAFILNKVDPYSELAKQFQIDKSLLKDKSKEELLDMLTKRITDYARMNIFAPHRSIGFTQGTLMASNEFELSMAKFVFEKRAAAIEAAKGIRIGGAAANYRYSELAAEKRALGSYLAGLGQTANDVLMQQIENNHRV